MVFEINSYCRRIESSVFIRNYIDFVSQVDWDWTTAFPNTFDFLNSEVERINDINELNIRNIFDDNIMSNTTEHILDQALLYFCEEFMKDGLCLVLLSQYVARALLLVLHRSAFIQLSAEDAQLCESTHTVASTDANNNEDIMWTKTSSTHAVPRMSFSDFQKRIEYTNFPVCERSKIEDLLVKAYGLCHECN